MSSIKPLFSALIIVAIFTVACTNSSNLDEVSGAEIEPQVLEESLPRNYVCEPLDIPGVAFPRQEYVEGPRETMAAELVGDLLLVDGYLQVKSIYGDGFVIPVWPAEFTVAVIDDSYVVLDGDENQVAREGEEVYMGGGEGSEMGMLDCVRQQLPETYTGKYWYVGEGVRPNLNFDSDLFTMDLVPAPDRTAILLKKEPILNDWTSEPDTFTGVLRFYYPDRCPRIKSESGIRDFLPIWPPGYSLQIADNLVEILDVDGNVVARQDETVTLHGALVPLNWENPNYRQLHYETPGDCFGPYWIVMTDVSNP